MGRVHLQNTCARTDDLDTRFIFCDKGDISAIQWKSSYAEAAVSIIGG